MRADQGYTNAILGEFPTRPGKQPKRAGGDKLTGLPDQWQWDEQAEDAVHAAQQSRELVTLLLVEVDRFTRINNDIGHPAGDAVLATLSRVLQSVLRSDTVLGRYRGQGGDGFVALLPGTTSRQARRVTQRLHHEIARLTVSAPTASGDHVPLTGFTVSVGVASGTHTDRCTVSGLIVQAESMIRHTERARGEEHEQIPLVEQRRRCSDPASHSETRSDLRLLLNFTQRLSGHWTCEVLLALSEEPRRYTDLLSAIRSATASGQYLNASVLNRTLRRLERDGLIHRSESGAGRCRAVRYSVTPLVHELLTTLHWGLSSPLQTAVACTEGTP